LKHFSKLRTTSLVATPPHPQIIITKVTQKIDFFPQPK
jgi:hypothetical protein